MSLGTRSARSCSIWDRGVRGVFQCLWVQWPGHRRGCHVDTWVRCQRLSGSPCMYDVVLFQLERCLASGICGSLQLPERLDGTWPIERRWLSVWPNGSDGLTRCGNTRTTVANAISWSHSIDRGRSYASCACFLQYPNTRVCMKLHPRNLRRDDTHTLPTTTSPWRPSN